jgi:hypothetical protein
MQHLPPSLCGTGDVRQNSLTFPNQSQLWRNHEIHHFFTGLVLLSGCANMQKVPIDIETKKSLKEKSVAASAFGVLILPDGF